MEQVGTIAGLWRYPVKSMQGEALAEAALGPAGLAGDRAYALLDLETGAVASAKHPRKWAALLACRAAFTAPPRPGQPPPPVQITLPDGAVVSSADPAADRALSLALGRPVRLVATAPPGAEREADRTPPGGDPAAPLVRREPLALGAPPGTFFDYGALHLLTQATLDRLGQLAPAAALGPARFRPNLLLHTGGPPGFVELAWLGRTLALGAAGPARAMDPTPRCVVTTLAQAGLPADPAVLRALAQHSAAPSVTLAPGVVFPAVAGIYLAAEGGGTLRLADPVALL